MPSSTLSNRFNVLPMGAVAAVAVLKLDASSAGTCHAWVIDEIEKPVFRPHEVERLGAMFDLKDDPQAVIRWRIRFRPPLVGKRRLHRLLPLAGQIVLKALLVFLSMGLLILTAFSALWWAGSLSDHSASGAAAIYAGIIGGLIVLFMITSRIGGTKGKGPMPTSVITVYLATIALPVTMYATSAPGAGTFTAFSGVPDPSLLDWCLFYSYMFLDSLLLGAPQALIGELSALKPASLQAAGMTFVIRTLMAIGLLVAIWDQIRELVKGGYEVSLSLREAAELLRSELRERDQVWIQALAVEHPIEAGAPAIPATRVIDVPQREAAPEVLKEWSDHVDPIGGTVNGKHVAFAVSAFCGGLSLLLLLSALFVDTRISELSLKVSYFLLWPLGAIVGIFMLLLGYGFARKGVRYRKVLRRAKRIAAIRGGKEGA